MKLIITILFCLTITTSNMLLAIENTQKYSIENEDVIEFYKIKLSKDQKKLEKTGPCNIEIRQLILNNHTDSISLYELTYINENIIQYTYYPLYCYLCLEDTQPSCCSSTFGSWSR